MKKFFVFSLLLLFVFSLKGQNANIRMFKTGVAKSNANLNSILQFQVENNEIYSFSGIIQVVIESENNGTVGVLRTNPVNIPVGVVAGSQLVGFNGNDLNLVSVRAGYENIKDIGFTFQDGNYTFCIELLGLERALIDRSCQSFRQVAINNFFLINPFHEDELENELVSFFWTPYLGNNQNLRYRVRWVETSEKLENLNDFYSLNDFYQLDNLKTNILPYSHRYPEFDKSKYYYWQVEAHDGRVRLGKSEIWEFTFNNRRAPMNQVNTYVKMDLMKLPALHYFTGDLLNFEWFNNYMEKTELEYEIFDEENELVSSISPGLNQPVVNGRNLFSLNVSSFIVSDKIYTLKVKGEKRTYDLNFKKISGE